MPPFSGLRMVAVLRPPAGEHLEPPADSDGEVELVDVVASPDLAQQVLGMAQRRRGLLELPLHDLVEILALLPCTGGTHLRAG
jgi:hypothetical protein